MVAHPEPYVSTPPTPSVAVQQPLDVDLHAVLCIAENAIGPKALRNDDIIHMYSGKTVEVNNTDAGPAGGSGQVRIHFGPR